MRFARGVLWLIAIVLTIGGAYAFTNPHSLTELADIGLPTANAVAEIRAYLGGRELGLVVFLFYCTRSAQTVWLGLLVAALGLFGSGGARLFSYFVDGHVDHLQLTFVGIDWGFAALGAVGAWFGRKALRDGPNQAA